MPLSPGWQSRGHIMPGVTVKDVKLQECVRTPAAFLKGSRKLKVPECVDTVKLAKHKELAAYNEKWFCNEQLPQPSTCTSRLALGLALKPRSVGVGGHQRIVSCPATSAEAPSVWPTGSSKPWRDGGTGPRWGLQTDLLDIETWTESWHRWQLPTGSFTTNDTGLINCLIH